MEYVQAFIHFPMNILGSIDEEKVSITLFRDTFHQFFIKIRSKPKGSEIDSEFDVNEFDNRQDFFLLANSIVHHSIWEQKYSSVRSTCIFSWKEAFYSAHDPWHDVCTPLCVDIVHYHHFYIQLVLLVDISWVTELCIGGIIDNVNFIGFS